MEKTKMDEQTQQVVRLCAREQTQEKAHIDPRWAIKYTPPDGSKQKAKRNASFQFLSPEESNIFLFTDVEEVFF